MEAENRWQNGPRDAERWPERTRDDGPDDDGYDGGPVACSLCGETLAHAADGLAEVVNRTTGAHSVAHAGCYLADTDCYVLA